MEPIDVAHQKLAEVRDEIESYLDTVHSEEDTRFKVINRIFNEVLLWPFNEIATEEYAQKGYVDYKLTVSGRAYLIVEAKRDNRSLELAHRASGQAYKLSGPVFQSSTVKEGIDQAVRYCGQKNAELACVTNGREWVVFRGSRLGDGLDTMDGMAFIFSSLDAVLSKFALFYDLLSYEAVSEFRYRSYFQDVEGRPIRAYTFRRAVRSPNSKQRLALHSLSADVDRVMVSFFRRLRGHDDPEMLLESFVTTRESQVADRKLARISEDLVNRIQSLDTSSGDQLTELIDRVKQSQRNEFILLVGTKGAGKSTFVERFFRYILPEQLKKVCVVVRVDLADSEGSESLIASWLDQVLLEKLETAIFDGGPSFEEIMGMFFDEYKRRSEGPLRVLHETDKDAFKIDFGRHIENRREKHPHEYIRRLVRHVIRVRKQVPCIVFDNADHFTIEFQERVFQYARSIYENELCLIIMPITDRTSWQLSRQGALRSFESESLFLPTPKTQQVLKKRIEFIDKKLLEEKSLPGHYFLGKGIRFSFKDIMAFTASLNAIFLGDRHTSESVGNLANQDVRECLELTKDIVTSPHVGVHELIGSYVSGTSLSVPSYKIKKAIIRGNYDIYPVGAHRFVHNIFAIEENHGISPLLGLRVLQLFRDAQTTDPENPFIGIDQVVSYFHAMLVESDITISLLGKMLELSLCLSYDPTIIDITRVQKVELSPSGKQHFFWGLYDFDYIQAMLEVTPITDEVTYQQLEIFASQPSRAVWADQFGCFIDYLVEEDRQYCKVPDYISFKNQLKLAPNLSRLANKARRKFSSVKSQNAH